MHHPLELRSIRVCLEQCISIIQHHPASTSINQLTHRHASHHTHSYHDTTGCQVKASGLLSPELRLWRRVVWRAAFMYNRPGNTAKGTDQHALRRHAAAGRTTEFKPRASTRPRRSLIIQPLTRAHLSCTSHNK